jgi:phage FluMu gp28-like protein
MLRFIYIAILLGNWDLVKSHAFAGMEFPQNCHSKAKLYNLVADELNQPIMTDKQQGFLGFIHLVYRSGKLTTLNSALKNNKVLKFCVARFIDIFAYQVQNNGMMPDETLSIYPSRYIIIP